MEFAVSIEELRSNGIVTNVTSAEVFHPKQKPFERNLKNVVASYGLCREHTIKDCHFLKSI